MFHVKDSPNLENGHLSLVFCLILYTGIIVKHVSPSLLVSEVSFENFDLILFKHYFLVSDNKKKTLLSLACDLIQAAICFFKQLSNG